MFSLLLEFALCGLGKKLELKLLLLAIELLGSGSFLLGTSVGRDDEINAKRGNR